MSIFLEKQVGGWGDRKFTIQLGRKTVALLMQMLAVKFAGNCWKDHYCTRLMAYVYPVIPTIQSLELFVGNDVQKLSVGS